MDDRAMEPKIKVIDGYWYSWGEERKQYVPTGVKKVECEDLYT